MSWWNPITAIAGVAGDAWGTYQERKTQAKQIEGKLAEKRLELKQARYQSKINALLADKQMDLTYDMQVLKNRQTTWLDELIGVAIVLMTAAAFVPGLDVYVKAGWIAISEAPFWFQFAWYTLITSTLGGLIVLRLLLGNRAGRAIEEKMKASLPSNGDQKGGSSS